MSGQLQQGGRGGVTGAHHEGVSAGEAVPLHAEDVGQRRCDLVGVLPLAQRR